MARLAKKKKRRGSRQRAPTLLVVKQSANLSVTNNVYKVDNTGWFYAQRKNQICPYLFLYFSSYTNKNPILPLLLSTYSTLISYFFLFYWTIGSPLSLFVFLTVVVSVLFLFVFISLFFSWLFSFYPSLAGFFFTLIFLFFGFLSSFLTSSAIVDFPATI